MESTSLYFVRCAKKSLKCLRKTCLTSGTASAQYGKFHISATRKNRIFRAEDDYQVLIQHGGKVDLVCSIPNTEIHPGIYHSVQGAYLLKKTQDTQVESLKVTIEGNAHFNELGARVHQTQEVSMKCMMRPPGKSTTYIEFEIRVMNVVAHFHEADITVAYSLPSHDTAADNGDLDDLCIGLKDNNSDRALDL